MIHLERPRQDLAVAFSGPATSLRRLHASASPIVVVADHPRVLGLAGIDPSRLLRLPGVWGEASAVAYAIEAEGARDVVVYLHGEEERLVALAESALNQVAELAQQPEVAAAVRQHAPRFHVWIQLGRDVLYVYDPGTGDFWEST